MSGQRIRMLSGLWLDAEAPTPDMIDLRDLISGLANTCRFAGHVIPGQHYSVAQHSVLLAEWFIAQNTTRLAPWALLHDAAEAYLSDMPGPFKAGLPDFQALERRIADVIFERFRLVGPVPDEVKAADKRIALDEQAVLQAPLAARGEPPGGPLGIAIHPWSADRAAVAFASCGLELAVWRNEDVPRWAK